MPMNGKYLLDTSIVIALFANDAKVKEILEKVNEVFVPITAIGELSMARTNPSGQKRIWRGSMNSHPTASFWIATQKPRVDMEKSKTFCEPKGVRFPKTTFGLRQLLYSMI